MPDDPRPGQQPGPLPYLGALAAPAGSGLAASAVWAGVALVFLFLPGLLVVSAGLPLWTWIGGHPTARGALAGVNAAAVGVLGAALYSPIWTTAILGGRHLAIALVAFMLLERWRVAPILIVVFCVASSVAVTTLG